MLIQTRHFSSVAILMLLAGVEAQHSVIVSSQSLCAVTGSTVKISCTFRPDRSSVTQREWYRVQNPEAEPRVLSRDPQYSERVSVNTVGSDCDLTVRNVSVSDSGVYKFRYKTHRSGWISTSGVHLTVTDLKVSSDYKYYYKVLYCITTCTNNPTYIWYRNGRYFQRQNKGTTEYVEMRWAGSFSCAIEGYKEFLSPAVCFSNNNENSCWSVTYFSQNICALIGSSVDIHSYYTFPDQRPTPQPVWRIRTPTQYRELIHIDGQVEYLSERANITTLRLKNLKMSDSTTYQLGFKAPYHYQNTGVTLSVTELKVKVESYSQSVTLSCISTCTPSNNPTYIWYRNGQRVSDCKSASCSVAAVAGAVSYSCAVEGHDSFLSPPVYSPKNTRAVVVPSGDTVEGDSVTLSCSSDANPPVVTYSWFQQRAAADTLLIPEQNYSISNICSQHSGVYYCTAHNRLGHNNSTLIHLDVFYPPRNRSVTLISSVSGDSITLSCESQSNPSSSYTWYWRSEGDVRLVGNGSNVTFSSRENGFYFCSARNRFGSSNSSEWENTAATDSSGTTAAVSGVTFILVLIFIAIFLRMRYSNWIRALVHSNRSEERRKNDLAPVYGNISSINSEPSQRLSSEYQNDVHYSSVYFRHSRIQEVPLYSTVQLPQDLKQEEKGVYARVNIVKSGAARNEEIYKNLRPTEKEELKLSI